MTAGPITRTELIALVERFESIFDGEVADWPAGAEPYRDDGAPQAFGIDIGGAGLPASPAFADALGERYVCALDDGTVAAWGAPKRLPRGFVSRELVFYPPAEQAGLSEDLVECRLCGRHWRSLGHHLVKSHDITANEYRDRFGFRRGTPLTGAATRARFSESARRTIDEGKLDAHYAGNADRAVEASKIGAAVKRQMRAQGIDLPHGTPAVAREAIEMIVIAVEEGASVARAVRASAIAYSTFHAGLARHPDLHARIEQLRLTRGKLRAGVRG